MSLIRRALLLLAAAVPPVLAQPAPERPNQLVFRSGAWQVVRSVREGGNVVACTGLYHLNPRVQLSQDMLLLKVPPRVGRVAYALDDAPLPEARDLGEVEKKLGAVAIRDEDFARLASARRLRIAAMGITHVIELRGFADALADIRAGCPRRSAP